jgi:hypothetical protein
MRMRAASRRRAHWHDDREKARSVLILSGTRRFVPIFQPRARSAVRTIRTYTSIHTLFSIARLRERSPCCGQSFSRTRKRLSLGSKRRFFSIYDRGSGLDPHTHTRTGAAYHRNKYDVAIRPRSTLGPVLSVRPLPNSPRGPTNPCVRNYVAN